MYPYPYAFLGPEAPLLSGPASQLPPFPASFPATVPSACLACRTKHLKCDGQRPCSRCVSVDAECTYVPSRRGYRGPSRPKDAKSAKSTIKTPRKPRKRLSLLPYFASASTTVDGPATSNIASVAPIPGTIVPIFNPPVLISNDASLHPLPFQSFLRTNLTDPLRDLPFGLNFDAFGCSLSLHGGQLPTPRDQYMDYFYHYFHATHPFVLPREYLLPLTNECNIAPVISAMRWIGSLYMTNESAAYSQLLDEAYRLIYDLDTPPDGFTVQAMLLLIIGLDAHRERDKVHKLLSDIESTSIQIGLNTRLFALVNGRGMPIIEESWRRTWWDLYVVDASIAGVHRSTRFLLYDFPTDVSLPCEEHQYLSGHIPEPLQLEDLNNNSFLNGGWEFSSFAYRVQCGLALGKLLRLPISGPKDRNIAEVRALLTTWQLHLPLSKRELYRDGQLDEMMFQAYMTANAISIILHQPFSQLDPSLTQYIDACAPNTPAISRDRFNSHTQHTIRAANAISHLITHRVSLLSHSHFFAYMITLAATVHLSEWTLVFVSQNDDNLRQRIRLAIGALDKYSEVWPAAKHLGGQVKGIAQEVYRVKREQQRLAQQSYIDFDAEKLNNAVVDVTDDSTPNADTY